MIEHTDFTSVLRAFMARAQRSTTDLARLTGLSINTLKNWRGGVVCRPQLVTDVLTLARALALDAADTTTLLMAARHPPLATLHAQAEQTCDSALRALLEVWPLPPVPDPAGAVAPPPAPPAPRVPRHQLRAPIADFVGRAREIDQLLTALRRALAEERGAIISGVQGMGGIGKTELAYAIAHQLCDAFPDAQLVLNLRGSSATPLTPEQTLQAVIHSLTPEAKLPDELAALEQHYRTLLYRSRMLILADDARDAAQVQGLLPPAGSAVLITSRQRFSLPGMATVQLEQLQADEAVGLLRAICPRLGEAEADLIARACGYLPLALRTSGSILHTFPAVSVASYLAQLGDERRRLLALRDPDDPQLDVEASLALSYAQLDHGTQQVFRQLGVLVADFATSLAQAVVEAPDGVEVEATLQRLLQRNLVLYDAEHTRWRLHDLVRDLARKMLEATGEAEAAYWRYARAAVQIARETQEQYKMGGDGVLAALARFDAERPHIDAGRGWAAELAGTEEGDRLLLDYAGAMAIVGALRYDRRRERLPEWERALAAVRRLEDRRAEGWVLNNLGVAYTLVGEAWRAILSFEQVLCIVREIGDRRVEGHALGNLGEAYIAVGDARRAIFYYEQALSIAHAIGDRRLEGNALNYLGKAYTNLGDTQHAILYIEQALAITRVVGDQNTEGYALSYLARVQAWQGDLAHATSIFEQAVGLFRAVGDRGGEAECNWLFGLALAQQGARERALPLLRAAVAYEQEIGHARAAEHAALLVRLEAGEELPLELPHPAADAPPIAAQP